MLAAKLVNAYRSISFLVAGMYSFMYDVLPYFTGISGLRHYTGSSSLHMLNISICSGSIEVNKALN